MSIKNIITIRFKTNSLLEGQDIYDSIENLLKEKDYGFFTVNITYNSI